MNQHTPGPWRIGDKPYRIVDGEGRGVAEACYRTEGSYDDVNARLIAAAPDLLAALKVMWAWEVGPFTENLPALCDSCKVENGHTGDCPMPFVEAAIALAEKE